MVTKLHRQFIHLSKKQCDLVRNAGIKEYEHSNSSGEGCSPWPRRSGCCILTLDRAVNQRFSERNTSV